MGNMTTHVRESGAHVPRQLRCAWAQKHDASLSHDGAHIDLHGGGHDWRKPKHLTGDELAKVTDTFVVSLVHDKVTSIIVACCKSLTDESIKAIAKLCPELKELNVSHCENLTDESIKAIATGCPELKMLDVSCYLSNLTDESIKAIATGCPGLEKLNVASCNNLTDKSIKAIAQGCPELKVLNVAGIEYLTDESIKAIAAGCPNLKELNVGSIENLTDEAIKAIAQGCCPEELNLAGIENITDDSIKAIAHGCPELKKLNVEYCRNLTRDAIKAIATGCHHLNRLNANLCGLTSLPEDIGEWLPELEHLSIADNNLTTLPPSIVKLQSLQFLDVDFNPLQSPPFEISRQGLAAITRYFEELEKGSSVSKLLKVVLVGDGKAGKTTLRNALAGRPKPRQENRTIHLDIEKITLTDDLDINVYDFGGQEEYLATQLPYLTGLALYVVVVDALYATDEYADVLEDKLLRFLIVLQNRVPGAVVLPIVTKVDTVEDPESRRLWLETKIDKWLHETREAVCCELPDTRSDSPPPPSVLLASCADAGNMRHAGNSDMHHFIPLGIQSPPLAVSVADTDDVDTVHDSVNAVRDRIIALTKHDPPLLRGVGQQIPSAYVAVLELFGAIAEYGDNDRALEALRHETAHALGETSKLSPDATYRPKDELEHIWNTYRNQQNGNVEGKVFEDATQLWEAQGLVFVDAGLVILQPEFITTIVKPLVDHRHNDENEYKYFEEVVAQFLESSSSWDNGCYEQLIEALDIFRASGEFESSEESLFLSFLWRDTGLEKCHYGQVLQMLTRSGVILKVERDADERCNVVVVPFRLPHDPDATLLEKFWPKLLPSNLRELKLRFEPRSGFPTGLAERFVSDVHGLGTSLYSWRTGVVVTDCAGYSALVERRKNVLHFTVRFESHSTEYADAAWNALCDAQQILAAQREHRFPGLFYMERFTCEECCRQGRRRSSTVKFDANRRESVFRACGHRFYLVCKRKCDVPTVTNNFMGPVSNAQFNGVVNGNANYT